jgi:hypothetical protein
MGNIQSLGSLERKKRLQDLIGTILEEDKLEANDDFFIGINLELLELNVVIIQNIFKS